MRGMRLTGAILLAIFASLVVAGCDWVSPAGPSTGTAVYSYGGRKYATVDGYWYVLSSGTGVGYETRETWMRCLNYIGIDCVDDADVTVERARALIEKAGGVIQAVARRPEYSADYATLFVVLPDPPRTPTAEEMRALYGEARVIPAVENWFHVHLRTNVPLIHWLKLIDHHRELFTDGGFGSRGMGRTDEH